jgi:hypothetical protein
MSFDLDKDAKTCCNSQRYLDEACVEIQRLGQVIAKLQVQNEIAKKALEVMTLKTLSTNDKPKKLWPAIVTKRDGTSHFTSQLFESREEVDKLNAGQHFIKWPAIPNADGSYDV